MFGRTGGYIMGADEVLAELKRYVAAETEVAAQLGISRNTAAAYLLQCWVRYLRKG